MKNYSSKQAKRGKLAYRTPDRFIFRQFLKNAERKSALMPKKRNNQKIDK